MIYRLVIDDAIVEQLRALPKEVRRNIGYRLDMLQEAFQGDVKKLEGDERRWRLRVGRPSDLVSIGRECDSRVCCETEKGSL
jgi:mRNA-degrading endonuclease RelE of RelBE toxin-antitoxin system